MRGRISPGPVFVFESMLAARRWQHYAGRAVFVLAILIGLWIVWSKSESSNSAVATPTGQIVYMQNTSLQQLAQVGEGFFYTLVIVQLSIVMLAAPAATAGSICIDRARGSLLHVMVTDLSDSEIVLGKMASRLVPTLGLIAAALPVASIGALLGGIDLDALSGLMVVSVGLALMGCALAMSMSMLATKVHEVLMAVYLIEGLALLFVPIWLGLTRSSGFPPLPDAIQKLNPFLLTIAPYAWPKFVTWEDYAIFLGASVLVSASLTLLCILNLRRVVITTAKVRQPLRWLQTPGWLRRFQEWSGPKLDRNPVLWREWHRNRPSRFARYIWAVLMALTWGSAISGALLYLNRAPGQGFNQTGSGFMNFGWMIQTFFGLLFLCAMAPTSLAEERVRGSLDVLISTPLSSREIVAGKWWGSFRFILPVAALPILVILFCACVLPPIDPMWTGMRWGQPLNPITTTDRLVAPLLSLGQWFSTGACIASMGVWLATRFERVGRAVTAGVVLYFLLGLGWVFLVEGILMPIYVRSLGNPNGYDQTFVNALMSICLYGPLICNGILENAFQPREPIWIWCGVGALFKGVVALLLFHRTVRIFDRHLGRVPEGGAPLPRRRPEFPDTQADPLPAQRLEPA